MNCVRSFDRDVLRAGVAAGLEALETAADRLACAQAGDIGPSGLSEVGTCVYRAGRAADTVGLAEIGRTAQEVEAALERLEAEASSRDLAPEQVALLEEAVDMLTALLLSVDARTGFYSAADDQGCLDRLKAACA